MCSLNKIKKELEILKSWGMETISIDKVLDMLSEDDYLLDKDYLDKDQLDHYRKDIEKFFRYIPMYVNTDRTYPHYNDYTLLPYGGFPHHNTGSSVPNSYIIVS